MSHHCAAICSSEHGQCQPVRGGADGRWSYRCACHPGWSGAACSVRAPSPCNTREGGRVLTRCAGTCDEDVNRCLCGPNSRFPERPMMHCRYEGVEKDMPWQTPKWAGFTTAPKGAFWTAAEDEKNGVRGSRPKGVEGWCDADPKRHQRPPVRCKCYDGQDEAKMCAPIAKRSTDATFCLNQCHHRGECAAGYCKCHAGYYGADCSMAAADPAPVVPNMARRRPGEAVALLPPRPRIYIYELPGDYNTFLLARRQSNDACAIRTYKGGLTWTGTLYGAEVALHEALLSSPHRVLDPALADYFYVPVYGGCYISEFNRPRPNHWLCDECHKGKPADLASLRAMRWHKALLDHISTAYPYWNASGGADHLWPFTHDEGACYAPSALSKATLLVHWGRTHLRPNGSSEYHLWRVKPHAKLMYGWTRCYDPCKDLVLPSWRQPDALLESAAALSGGGGRKRKSSFLFYFNGVLGTGDTRTTGGGDLANYSFGLRQQLYSLFGGKRSEGVVVTDVKTPNYRKELSASTFCGVLPGWGWSGRMEDAVLHGCIPVILQDGIHTPWESMLDVESYSLRITRADMPRLLETLRAVPKEKVAAMQAALRRVWPRFSYLSVAVNEMGRREGADQKKHVNDGAPPSAAARDAASRDAVATLLQALRVRLRVRAARQAGQAFEPGSGCAVEPKMGGETSAAVARGEVGEAAFEGRVVNGWTI